VEALRDKDGGLGFFPRKTETDIWMQKMGYHYEYICVYVDNLIICSKKPSTIIEALEKVHKFKLKGTGSMHFHLGSDYFRDKEGTMCYGPKKYISELIDKFQREFGKKPKLLSLPLERGDHPKQDTSELLDMKGVKLYQSLIGSLQWIVQLGRLDIATAIMSLSGYRAAPRKGHHAMIMGRSVTGILHLVKQSPFDWFSKKQSTVETATYGSEFVAAHTATEQIMANRAAFRYISVSIEGPTFMFGDNRSVIDSSTVPQSSLSKRHVALSYHQVREAIAAKVICFMWIDSASNQADILSKH
jgi:hypothetical protein